MRPTAPDTISSARESARHANGRFGTQPRAEADVITLLGIASQRGGPDKAALDLHERLSEIHERWTCSLQCAAVVAALDRHAERGGYDASRVVTLCLHRPSDSDNPGRYEAVAFDDRDEALGRLSVRGVAIREDTMPETFAVDPRGHDVGIDVAAVRSHDWVAGDFEYREQLVAAALGEEYHLGVAFAW
jgi:hypothetical protein